MEDKIRRKYNKKGRALLFASLFVLLISVLGLYYFIFAPTWPVFNFLPAKELSPIISSQTSTAALVANDCPDCQPRWLDGILVPVNEVNAFPVAVVIDNDVLARPQAGLARASLVYEAPVEGGMTRYLAIFPADIDLEVIGPVRSARPYFVVWAEELRALFVHCGGSPEALARLKADTVYDLNEFYNNAYFWREESDNRSAPHNVLISGTNGRAY